MHDTLQFSSPWLTENAEELYRIKEWGNGFFGAADDGNLEVELPDSKSGSPRRIPLTRIIEQIEAQTLSLPVVLRFPDLIAKRVRALHGAFANAMQAQGYRGDYRGVFPIKVNQKRTVVEEIAAIGAEYHYGLEVGSKAELIASLGNHSNPEAYLICNGYKDATYIRLALLAKKAGLKIVLVIEMLSELRAILAEARKLRIQPSLGIRYRLSKAGNGRWRSSNGENGLFGLSGLEVIKAIDTLRAEGALGCLEMLHFHQGSQLCDLNGIRSGVREATRVYADLVAEGAPLGALNLGGGLAVDYDGTATAAQDSKNYTLREYCTALVEETLDVLNEAGVPHPQLLTESGRGVCAHSSALIFEVFDGKLAAAGETPFEVPEDAHPRISEIVGEILATERDEPADLRLMAKRWREELHELFGEGAIRLRDIAMVDRVCRGALERAWIPNSLEVTEDGASHPMETTPDVIYGNFSVFQSLPDHWALGQMFPVLPIHRLNERPERQAILADLTCDSDGKVKGYISSEIAESLPVHQIREGEPYLFGAFLIGAYQETLGDNHNLFGAPNVVNVRLQDGELKIGLDSRGESVADILRTMDYQPEQLLDRVKGIAERSGLLSDDEFEQYVSDFWNGMRGYSYLSSPSKQDRE